MNSKKQPKIAIINSLARSGGTLINRCIGSMEASLVLSEIHPHVFTESLLSQAQEWFGLVLDETFNNQHTNEAELTRLIKLISDDVIAKEQSLILRNWNHIDFIAQPFLAYPTYKNSLQDCLVCDYDVRSVAIIRHPIDQWQSMSGLTLFSNEKLPVAHFLQGYLSFIHRCCSDGFIRYEDLVEQPNTVFADICEKLDLKYDAGYIDKWFDYDYVTGDIHKGGRGFGRKEIVTMPRKLIPKELLNRFLVQPQYQEILELTGYHAQ